MGVFYACVISVLFIAQTLPVAFADDLSSSTAHETIAKAMTESLKVPKNIEYGGFSPLSREEIARINYEGKLLKWKSKQSRLWSSLPKDPFTINASAYTAAADECGKNDGITASGIQVQKSRTLACPPEYPFGATIRIDGMGTYVCEDRGGAIKGNKFDIYMETKKEAFAFGRRNLTAQVIFE